MKSETWNTTFAEENKGVTTQRAMESEIESINKLQHTTNEELRSGPALKDIVEEMYKRKLGWAGHVVRLNDYGWTK